MSFSARILLVLSLVSILFFQTLSPTFAQTNLPSSSPYQQAQLDATRIQTGFAGFAGALICQLSGVDIFKPGYNCLGQKMTSDGTTPGSQTNTQPLGVIGMLVGGISGLYQKPVSTSDSIHYFASNFGIIKNTYAQDSGGFQSFSFIQNMFTTFRNLSFMFMVFIFILIGIAIMLRFRIDPRTVMSIQNQLPKIVISIILITFSYSIAGFLVDGMWLLTYFSINTISDVSQNECDQGGNGNTFAGVASQGLLNNPVAFAGNVFNDAGCFGKWGGISGLSKDVGWTMGQGLSGAIIEAVGLDAQSAKDCNPSLFHPDVGDCIQAGIYGFLTFLIGIIAILVVLFALILALMRLWITLIKAYVYILLDIITAPFQILIGILPGNRMGFGRWIKHLIAHLLVFPAAAAMMVLAVAFALNSGLNKPDPNTTFYPPLIGIPGLTGNLGNLVAFGILMITPELLQMIKDAFGVKSNSALSGAVVGGFMKGVAPTRSLGGLGGEIFGKDKNGQPRAARAFLEKKWANAVNPNSSWMKGTSKTARVTRKPIELFRKNRAWQEEQKLKALNVSRSNINTRSMEAFQHEMMQSRNTQAAANKAAEVLRGGSYNSSYITEFLKSRGVSDAEAIAAAQHTSSIKPPIVAASNNTTGGGNQSGQTATNPAHAAGNNPATQHSSAAASGTATSSGGSGAAGSHPTGTTGAPTTPHTTTIPKIKVKWVGNQLRLETDTAGTGQVLATRNATSTVFTPSTALRGSGTSLPYDQLAGVLDRFGYEEAP